MQDSTTKHSSQLPWKQLTWRKWAMRWPNTCSRERRRPWWRSRVPTWSKLMTFSSSKITVTLWWNSALTEHSRSTFRKKVRFILVRQAELWWSHRAVQENCHWLHCHRWCSFYSSRFENCQHFNSGQWRPSHHWFRLLRNDYGKEAHDPVQCRLAFLHVTGSPFKKQVQWKERYLVSGNNSSRDAHGQDSGQWT